MESKTNGRVQRSAAEWQQLVSRFTESGRSRAAFCRAEGISPATFRWCKAVVDAFFLWLKEVALEHISLTSRIRPCV
jgi:hypothetical protein